MTVRNVRRLAALGAGVLLVASGGGTARREAPNVQRGASAAVAFADATAHCCFTNPRYVGTCHVAPAADETCASILAYLNNPQSQGKSYCGSTTIRGDWKTAACEAKPSGD